MAAINLGVWRNIQRLQSSRITKSPLICPKDFFRFANVTTCATKNVIHRPSSKRFNNGDAQQEAKEYISTDDAFGSSIHRQFGPYLKPPATYMPRGSSQQDKSSTIFNIVWFKMARRVTQIVLVCLI